MPEDWQNINFAPLEDIGFSVTQLNQLYKLGSLTPEIVQETINHFAFGLEHKGSASSYSKNPLKVLMGNLRKGNAWIESGYESPQDRAVRELLAFKKQQAEKRKAHLDELFTTCFKSWFDEQTNEFLKSLIPNISLSGFKKTSTMVTMEAQAAFKETKEWQDVLKTLNTGNSPPLEPTD